MNSADLRRSNLMDLVERYDTQHQFAAAAQIDPGHLSRILSGTKAMGNLLARRIESRLDLPESWLDQAHHEDQRIWLRLFCALLSAGRPEDTAADIADTALQRYKSRW